MVRHWQTHRGEAHARHSQLINDLLFSHTATALKMMLLFRGGPQVVVVNAPWYLRLRQRRRRWRLRRGHVPLAARTAET